MPSFILCAPYSAITSSYEWEGVAYKVYLIVAKWSAKLLPLTFGGRRHSSEVKRRKKKLKINKIAPRSLAIQFILFILRLVYGRTLFVLFLYLFSAFFFFFRFGVNCRYRVIDWNDWYAISGICILSVPLVLRRRVRQLADASAHFALYFSHHSIGQM